MATAIIATLLMLSGTLMATTMFPHFNAARMAIWLSVALAAGLAATGIVLPFFLFCPLRSVHCYSRLAFTIRPVLRSRTRFS